MGRYIVKRILTTIPVLIGVMLVIFIMLSVIPGDPVTVMMKEHVKPELIEKLKESKGLDDPALVRFFRYLWDALHGDLGVSYKLNRNVTDLIMDAFPHTVKLTVFAALVAWAIGIPAGIFSAIKKNTIIDRLFMSGSLIGVSMPVFWAALLL